VDTFLLGGDLVSHYGSVEPDDCMGITISEGAFISLFVGDELDRSTH